MESTEQSTGVRTFRVGMWAKTGMYLANDDPLILRNFPIGSGDIDIVFSTYREIPDGFTAPVPFGISVVVDGPSTALGQAVQDFGNTVRGLTALLSVAANTAIDEPTAYIAIETTPGSTTRDFWTQMVAPVEWPMGPGRLVPAGLFPPMIEAFYTHDDQERFHRAVVQYHHALQAWEPGTEIAALNHIWIGMEALTRLVRSKLERDLGLDGQALAKLYLPHEKPREDGKYDLNKLDAQIRLRHLFQGDADTHRWAKKASDGYEHAYDPLWSVRDRAVKAAQASLGYLRAAIFECGSLDADYRVEVMGDHFAYPHTNKVHIAVQGEMRGPASQLDRIDALPAIHLMHEPGQFGVDPLGDARVVFRTGMRVEWLPEEVELHPDSPEIVALPGTVGGTELIVAANKESVGEGQTRLSWQADVRNGRGVLSITDASLLSVPVSTQPKDVVSVDPLHEYRVVHVDGHAAGINQEQLAAIFVKYQAELAAEGWDLLCIIPSGFDESHLLVCRREATPADPTE